MSDFDNTNKGTLFINTKKQKDTHPTMKGSNERKLISYVCNRAAFDILSKDTQKDAK